MAKLAATHAVGPRPGRRIERPRQLGQVGLGESGRPDDGVDPGGGAEGDRGPRHVERVKSTTTSAPASTARRTVATTATGPRSGGPGELAHVGADVTRVDGGHQFQAGRRQHGTADLPAHPAAGADDTDPHGGNLAKAAPGGPRRAACRTWSRSPRRPDAGDAGRSATRATATRCRTRPRRTAHDRERAWRGGQLAGRGVHVLRVSASTRASTSSTVSTSPWSRRPAPIRLMRAPESSHARSVSARRFPLAMASSARSPRRHPGGELVGDDGSTSGTCSGAVPSPMLREPASR